MSEIKINYDSELINLLCEANKLISSLNEISSSLPDKDIFISKYVEKGYLKQLGLNESDLANYSYSDL